MTSSPVSDYSNQRKRIIDKENKLFVGGNLVLNEDERKLDTLIVQAKCDELDSCYNDTITFLPKQHFFKSKNKIENSKIFKILREMPKGHSLHTHLLAAASADFILKKLTYKENAFGKYLNDKFKVKFMKPEKAKEDGWTSLKEMREKDENFDAWLKSQFSLFVTNPEEVYGSIEEIWLKFERIFAAVYDIFCYKPAFEEYYYQCLKELYEDNVMYCEFRGELLPLYDLEDTKYNNEDFIKLILDVEEKFKKDHTDFIGTRYIHSHFKEITVDAFKTELKDLLELKKKFPKYIIGLDFVGFEDRGNRLEDFYHELYKVKDDINFFFHVGETNWFGHTDMNILDAVLMKSKRIGHGFALPKHPVLLDLVIEENIAIEICPISHQVLLLNDDPRNHSAATLLSKGVEVVVCNDDPMAWDATGLSYDFYVTFMAMTPRDCGLKFLKQLALNSINHSDLDEDKSWAMEVWTRRWNKFVSEMLKKLDSRSKKL